MYLYLLLFCCGNPPPVESSMSQSIDKESEKPKDDIAELQTVTKSLQKDISALSIKVDNLEKAIQAHISDSKEK